MTSVFYYSNFCEHSRKILQKISKTDVAKNVHFLCIDKRITDKSGKTFIITENQQQIILPNIITKVPALMNLNNFSVTFGDDIYFQLKPAEEVAVQKATQNNMEPMSFSMSSNMFGIVSDQYSFLDMDSESLNARGDGGLRQMHNYASLSHTDASNRPAQANVEYKSDKLSDSVTIEKLQKERQLEYENITRK